jgi:two-component system, sensor histidine kinase and response regulator
MNVPIRVLIVEDSPADAELIAARLNEEGFIPDWQRVQAEPDYLAALATPPALILADWNLPQFSGLRALKILRERGLDIPFVIVSGNIAVEDAADALRQGAYDYVFKDNPIRLGQAIRHALEDKQLREERRQAAESFRRERNLLRTLMDNLPSYVYIKDMDGRYVINNSAHSRFLGKATGDEVIGKTVFDLFSREMAENYDADDRSVMQSGHPVVDREEPSLDPAGNPIWNLTTKVPLRDPQGKIIGLVGISRNITELKQAQVALLEYNARLEREVKQRTQELEQELMQRQEADQARRLSEAYVRNIFDSSLDMIVTVDNERRIVEFNRAAQETFGYASDDVIGKHINILYANTEESETIHKSVVSRDTFVGEVANKRKNGEVFISLLSSAIMHDPQGKPVGLVGVSRDISERKDMEVALRRSREELEQRVQERTEELQQANIELKTQVAERITAQSELADEKERLALTLRSIGDAVITTDRDGRIVLFNPIAEQLTGWSINEALGQPLADVFFIVNTKTLLPSPNLAMQVLQTGVKTGLPPDTALVPRDGKEYSLSASFAPIRDNIGEISGVVIVFRDITLIRKAERALQDARAAEAANQAKSQFLAHMSHEIRTPIHGITGLAALLGNTEMNVEQNEYLTMIKSSADILLDTVNDILDFSKIEAGRFELEHINFDLISVVERAMDQPALRARKKGVEMVCKIAPSIPTHFLGDAVRLRQILVNLVGNAVKFTERGEIVVTAENEPITKMLQFAVRDTGIGIPEEKQKLIFEAFRQSDDSTARRYGGTGLGLSIVKKLVELMEGRVWVSSHIGEGSTFHFIVKLASNPQSTPVFSPDPAWRETSVLVIDDNMSSRAMLAELLASWGLQVTETSNALAGLQAIETAQAEKRPFRLILLDSAMPKMDGFRAAEWFRDDMNLRQSIVMMLSSDDVHSELAHCRELGIAFHLIKPIKQLELFGIVKSALNPHFDLPNVPVTDAIAPTSAQAASSTRVLFVEDNSVNQLVGTKLLEQAGFTFLVARNGKQALYQIATNHVDLILMDVEMPEMDGLEATRAIRRAELDSGSHIPIIAMTAYGSHENREACLQAGMDGYLSKPFTPEKLHEAMQPFVQAAPAPLTPPRIDRDAALQAVGGSEEFLHEAVKAFIEDDYRRHRASITEGLAQQDIEAIRQAAHGLKGALSTFGGVAACDLAHQIELAAKANDLTAVPALCDQLKHAVSEFAEYFGLALED